MKGLSKCCFSKKSRTSYYCLKRHPLARLVYVILLLIASVLLLAGNVDADDSTDFMVWNFPESTTYDTNTITIPADGYLGIRAEYDKSKVAFGDLSVEIQFYHSKNGCYGLGIPTYCLDSASENTVDTAKSCAQMPDLQSRARQVHTRPALNTIKKYDSAETNVVPDDGNAPPDLIPSPIGLYSNIASDVIYFDTNTPVPPGIIDIQVKSAPLDKNYKIVPYKLSVFWDQAFPDSDLEYNRVFDKPLDLGTINPPYQFPSHIGWMTNLGIQCEGKWVCMYDKDDYFKFKVQTSGYYSITYTSINDWGIDTESNYCMPAVSGLYEEDASGRRNLNSDTWWLKEKDRIGPFYLSAGKTYYMDFQREYLIASGYSSECNASVLFKIEKAGYTKYEISKISVFPAVGLSGEEIEFVFQVSNEGTVDGKPFIKMTITNPSGLIVQTEQQLGYVYCYSYNPFVFKWMIPRLYKNEGIHNIKVEIFEGDQLRYTKSSKLLVLKKLPSVAPLIDLLLLPAR